MASWKGMATETKEIVDGTVDGIVKLRLAKCTIPQYIAVKIPMNTRCYIIS